MPQISDLMWLNLFMYFNISMFIMMSMIYFNYLQKINNNNNNNNNLNNKKLIQFNLKW